MLKNILIQTLVVVFFFNVVSYLRETALLDSDTQVPEFSLMTVEGQTMTQKDLEGKPTLIYFWAPWCSVCKHSLPNLESFF